MNQMDNKILKTDEFNFELSEDRIPKYPLEKRDQSKLLVYDQNGLSDRRFSDIVDLLNAGDRLVVNNTKVIKARLYFKKPSGKIFEVFCLEPSNGRDPAIALSSKSFSEWNCLVKGSKKWGDDDLDLVVERDSKESIHVKAHKVGRTIDGLCIRFSWNNDDYCFADILSFAGAIPIPPYLNRQADESDEHRYQTVYAAFQGSVAAPTAGLHFTPEIMSTLREKGVNITELTLHVGAGTFRPVKDEFITSHEMHEELISVPLNAISELIQTKGRIIPVGTTSMRTLESLYSMAYALYSGTEDWKNVGQWDYERSKEPIERSKLLEILKSELLNTGENQLQGKTGIMIVPGYNFKMCDALITNFHQPKSTLIMLVAAFVGEEWKSIYNHALKNDYRFLSYGDSSFLVGK